MGYTIKPYFIFFNSALGIFTFSFETGSPYGTAVFERRPRLATFIFFLIKLSSKRILVKHEESFSVFPQ